MNPPGSFGISIGTALGAVAMSLRPITVRITSIRGSHGAGIIWHSRGLIVTNAHVAESGVHTVHFSDGTTASGWVRARDLQLDLAALAVSAGPLAAARTRSTRDLRSGELVVAMGHPQDGEGAIAAGIVHRPVGNQARIFADIRLAPGNSGGPLADTQGRIAGVNSMMVGDLGCAVTSDAVEDFLRRFRLAEDA